MKKQSNRRPRTINASAYMQVIKGFSALTQDDKIAIFKQSITAINRMQFGIDVSTNDFTAICDMLNISLLLTEKDIGKEYIAELHEAREAMQDAKQRYIKTQKLGFTATELKAVKVALTIHEAQVEVCTLGEYAKAFTEQEKRIKQGYFYNREGDLKVAA